jgi:uncharacterized protein
MMNLRAVLAATLLAICAALAVPASAAPQFPPLTGRVTDAANIIPDDVEARLVQKLDALEKQSQRQLVVATIPDLQGYEISDYGYQLGRNWSIGAKERNDGTILIVAPNERKVRIEVGYGVEPYVTDGFSSDVINQAILPRFKAGDMPGGIEAGTDALIRQLTLPPEEAQKIAAQADASQQGGDIGIGQVIFILFIIFFFVLPVLGSMFGGKGRRRSGWGSPVVWIPGSSSGWGGGGGSSWGGGGGFSGGGGSFGGGGSSGRW